MKKSRFGDEQVVTIVREAHRVSVTEVAKKYGISETVCNWRQHFGNLEVAGVKRFGPLEQENTRLKRILAGHEPELDEIREINAKKWQMRVPDASRWTMPGHRACRSERRTR